MYTHTKKVTVPLLSLFIYKWQNWLRSERKPHYNLAPMKYTESAFPPYAIDMWPLLALPFGTLDEAGVPSYDVQGYPAKHHPTVIAQYALAHWNAYIATEDQKHREAFMIQANWLVAHEARLSNDRGGWPLPFPLHRYSALNPWLSALTQGNCISVLVRAYRLTGEDVFLRVARRAIRTFELDINEGGVSTSIGEKGIFFEEVATNPPAHILNGYILALFGLYDYVSLTDDPSIAALIQRSLVTIRMLIEEYDAGYWSYYDLRFKSLAPRFYHALHITLLQALAIYSGCEHYATVAERWVRYQKSLLCLMRYLTTVLAARAYRALHIQ